MKEGDCESWPLFFVFRKAVDKAVWWCYFFLGAR